MQESPDLPRKIGFWGGSAIMVGIIIGSGIFKAPTAIAREMGSPGLILGLWVLGGVLSLLGALTYAELGAMFPRSGGIYVFIHQGLGGMAAFVFGWSYMLLTKPLAAAGIAVVFGEHFNQLFHVSWDPRIPTCALILALTAVNVIGVKAGTGLAVGLTALKVAALVMIVGLGLILAPGGAGGAGAAAAPKPLLQALTPVLFLILWTYDGWSDVASLAGEVRDPGRTLPRILILGTAATIAIYVAVNWVYFSIVPPAEMRTLDTVAPRVMQVLLGGAGTFIVTLMIVLSTAGATHGSIMTGARVTFAQARDGLLFRFLGRVHPKLETPDVSLWVQAALSCAAILWFRTFDRLAGGFVFTMWIFYAMAAAAVIVLRVRRPDLERPYRCWGYPAVPAVFVLVSLAMIALEVANSPKQTLPWLGVLAAGVPVYYLWKHVRW